MADGGQGRETQGTYIGRPKSDIYPAEVKFLMAKSLQRAKFLHFLMLVGKLFITD